MLQIDCPATWRAQANITLVGEAPGETESKCNIPLCSWWGTSCKDLSHREGFTGKTGEVLNKQLALASINRQQCHIINVAKRRPQGNDFKAAFYARNKVGRKTVEAPTQELLDWYKELALDLATHPTNVIVAVGGEALKALCGVEGITHYRGSVLESTLLPGRKVVPILHPSFVVRGQFGQHWIAGTDLKRVRVESAYPEIRRRPWFSQVFPDYEAVLSFLKAIPDDAMWALDIETRGDTLACLGIGWSSDVLCIPFQVSTGPTWSVKQETTIWQEVQALARRNPNLVGQNIQYDLEYLLDYGVEPSGIRLDTRIGHALLYPELPHTLEFMTSLYTDIPYYKCEGKTWGSRTPDEDLFKYNCKDVWATLEVARGLEKEMCEKGLETVLHLQAHAAKELDAAIEMQRVRLKVDGHMYKKLSEITREALDAKHKEVVHAAGRELNVGSGAQVARHLYGELGLKPKHNRKTKVVTTDENALRELRVDNPTLPLLTHIIEERHLRKKQESYLQCTIDPDGYLPYMANVAGTETWRWTMGSSPKWRGTSPQTMPPILRAMYVPPRGRVFISPDLSQVEARVVAWLSECQRLINLFSDPKRNVHLENAARLWPGVKVTKDTLEYTLAKSMLHAANFGMEAARLAQEIGLSLAVAEAKLEGYHRLYPEVRLWHAKVREEVVHTGRLTNPFGRVRTFYEALGAIALTVRMSREQHKDAIAFLPQSTAPDILNRGMLASWEALPYMWLHVQMHDGYLASVPDSCVKESCDKALQDLKIVVMIHGRPLMVPAEMKVGWNWGEMMPYQGSEITRGEWETWRAGQQQRNITKYGSYDNYLRKEIVGIA